MTTILSGRWVFDSNLFVYFLDRGSPFYNLSKNLFSQIFSGKIEGIAAHQNIIETERALVFGYKLSLLVVVNHVEEVLESFNFQIIYPLALTLNRYSQLLKMSKKRIDLFDYYLAATMLDNGINRILTVNTKDFENIKEIEAVNPFAAR